MFYSVASLLLIGDLWRCESWQWYHCVVVPSLFLRPARSPIEVVVIFILLVSFSMVFLTKPYLMLLAGFFIGATPLDRAGCRRILLPPEKYFIFIPFKLIF